MEDRRTVGDYVSLQRGITYKGKLVGEPGPALLGLGSIQPGGGFREADYKTYGGECPDNIMLSPGDLFASLKGATKDGEMIGSVAKLPESVETGRLTQDTVKLEFHDPNDRDRDFLYWVLRTPQYRAYCGGRATGSAVVALSRDDFLSFPVPEITQERLQVVELLETIHNKIELNRRMNATLEEMAQALFKSWFVDFDPVIDNALAAGNPIPDELAPRAEVRKQALESNKTFLSADSSGVADAKEGASAKAGFPAAFQFTEELGWIPEGWTLRSFESLATLETESVKPFEQPSTVWEHYSIPSYDSSGMPSWDRGDEIKSNKYRVKPGAVLSSKLNPETERTWWPFMLDAHAAICSTEFMQFVPKNQDEQAFVYSLIRSEPFQANILKRVTGSTGSRQRAQPKEIAKIGILDCGDTLRAEFVKVALPLFQSVRSNSLQNQTLKKLRDTLLPKLISGGVSISNSPRTANIALI